MLDKIFKHLSKPDRDVVMAYRYKLPKSIRGNLSRDENGHYIFHVKYINDEKLENTTFYVESGTLLGLIDELNDNLLEYLDFPRNIRSEMPKFLPPKKDFDNSANKKTITHKQLSFAK